MTIVKWTVSPFNSPPARQEYSHETAKFYMHSRGRGRDPKDSTWFRYFDSEQEALDFIRQREENKAEQKRVDQINRCGTELLAALESLVLFTNPKPSNSVALNNAYQVIAKAKGEA